MRQGLGYGVFSIILLSAATLSGVILLGKFDPLATFKGIDFGAHIPKLILITVTFSYGCLLAFGRATSAIIRANERTNRHLKVLDSKVARLRARLLAKNIDPEGGLARTVPE